MRIEHRYAYIPQRDARLEFHKPGRGRRARETVLLSLPSRKNTDIASACASVAFARQPFLLWRRL